MMVIRWADHVKVFLSDIDGTLTDGGYIVATNSQGEYARRFNTRDFFGIEILHKAGIYIGFITTASDPCRQHFTRAAKYAELITGCHDKLSEVRRRFVETGLCHWSEIAFIGDDLNDIGLLSKVGYPGCPADAAEEVKEVVRKKPDGFISTLNGGDGCVREFVNIIRHWEGVTDTWLPPREPV